MGVDAILNCKLDTSSKVPLYYQLVTVIKRYIMNGIIVPGDLLPSELELCEKLSISRSTVRRCFEALEAEGLVNRQQGKGTYVSTPKLKRSLNNLYSFSGEMENLGLIPKSEILSFELIPPADDLIARFKLSAGERIYKIVRLRSANAEPLMIETVFVPEHICPGIDAEQLKNSSLYTIITEKTGLIPVRAVESYEATIIDENEAQLLHCQPGNCAFFVQRISENSTGEVFELAIMLVRGDRFRYEVELLKDNVSVSRKFSRQ